MSHFVANSPLERRRPEGRRERREQRERIWSAPRGKHLVPVVPLFCLLRRPPASKISENSTFRQGKNASAVQRRDRILLSVQRSDCFRAQQLFRGRQMPPGVGDCQKKKKRGREYHPGGGPAGPPPMPRILPVFKILAAPPCATIVRGPHRIPTMVRRGPPRPHAFPTSGRVFPHFAKAPRDLNS